MGKQRLQVTLSIEQTGLLLEEAQALTAAELEADCEPSGYGLEVSITGVESWAVANLGGRRIDLGAVDVNLIDEKAR